MFHTVQNSIAQWFVSFIVLLDCSTGLITSLAWDVRKKTTALHALQESLWNDNKWRTWKEGLTKMSTPKQNHWRNCFQIFNFYFPYWALIYFLWNKMQSMWLHVLMKCIFKILVIFSHTVCKKERVETCDLYGTSWSVLWSHSGRFFLTLAPT